MPGALDTEVIAEAVAIIDELGKEITWREWARDGTQYDPATGVQPGVSTDHVDIVTSPPLEYDRRYVSGSAVADTNGALVLDGDTRIFLASASIAFVPKAGDEAIVDGLLWTCVGVKTYYSGRRVALYEAHMRRRG